MRLITSVLIAAMAALQLNGCATDSKAPPPVEEKLIASTAEPANSPYANIAFLLPLSGDHSEIGTALKDAASLALTVTDNVELSVYDTGNTDEQAVKAAREALARKPILVFGPLFAHTTELIAPLAKEARIPLISLSNNRNIAGSGVVSFGFQPGEQMEAVINFAGSRGISEYFLLLPANDFGRLLEPAIRRQIQAMGGIVVKAEHYTNQPDSQELAAKNIHNSILSYSARDSADTLARGIVIIEGGYALANLLGSLETATLPANSFRLLGSGQWDDPATISIPGVSGAWFASASLHRHQAFVRMFTEHYNYQPPWIASLSFDAIGLAQVVAQQLKTAPDPKPFVSEILLQQQGFSGIDGIFRINNQGYTERGLAIIEIEKEPAGFKEIQPAPEHF